MRLFSRDQEIRQKIPCKLKNLKATLLNPVKQELEEHILHNITVEDYMHLKRSGKVSYEEAVESSLDNRHSILQAKVRLEPDDVSAWLELIDIQVSSTTKYKMILTNRKENIRFFKS